MAEISRAKETSLSQSVTMAVAGLDLGPASSSLDVTNRPQEGLVKIPVADLDGTRPVS